MDDKRLERIESKIDLLLDRQSGHGHRITALETKVSYMQAAWGLLITSMVGVVSWALKKV